MTATAPRRVFLRAVAEALPAGSLTNQALAVEHPEWDVDKVSSKTGIVARRIVAPGQTGSDLAEAAARRLLAATGEPSTTFDYLLYCTQSPDHFLPATACILQDRLGLPTTAGALDFNQGCSGYIYGLQLARALIASGEATNVLLLTGETYSRYIHPDDRTVRMLFGDAGSATWVSADGPGALLGPSIVGTDGRGAKNLIVPAGASRRPFDSDTAAETADEHGNRRSAENLFMDGREVFNFTLERIPPLVDALVTRGGRPKGEIAWWVLHQANRFMNDHLRRKLGIPADRVPERLQEIGNTVSATIPLVLTAHGARFAKGETVALLGFGVGYSWGGMLLEWDPAVQLAGGEGGA